MSAKPAAPAASDYSFKHAMRVRWAEVDPQGIVFNPNYFVYADVALTEYWRAAGIDYAGLLERTGLDTFMVSCRADWFASARFDEEIALGVRLERAGRTSLTFGFAVFAADGAPLVRGELVYVFARPGPPRSPDAVPADLVSALGAFEARPGDARKGRKA
ncbi:MAG: acyl-CoA thioesterase [Oceanicaulis sp.]|nr:acyl-CoA thioesterase [Oceanicaulis sp.]